MRRLARRVLLGLVSALLLAATANSAGAIEVDPGGTTFSRTEALVLLSEGGFITPAITCAFTLESVLNTTIADSAGASAGRTTDIDVGICSGGEVIGVNIGNWPMTYQSKDLASSPKSLLFRQESVQFAVTVPGVTCSYSGSVNRRLVAEGSPLVAQAFVVERTLLLRKVAGSVLCPPRAGWEGEYRVTTQTLVL